MAKSPLTLDDDGNLRSPSGAKVARVDPQSHALMLYDKRTRTSWPLTIEDWLAITGELSSGRQAVDVE